MVNGSSRGNVAKPVPTVLGSATTPKDPYDKMAWVKLSEVNIGAEDATTGPHIKGSVYGGGENGHVFLHATVNVMSGTIGIVDENDPWFDFGIPSINETAWTTRGNVFGAGCGTDTYTDDNGKELHNPWAGCVVGNTSVNISGGWVGSLKEGDENTVKHEDATDGFALSWPVKLTYGPLTVEDPVQGTHDTGKATVNITGGRIGTTGSGKSIFINC